MSLKKSQKRPKRKKGLKSRIQIQVKVLSNVDFSVGRRNSVNSIGDFTICSQGLRDRGNRRAPQGAVSSNIN